MVRNWHLELHDRLVQAHIGALDAGNDYLNVASLSQDCSKSREIVRMRWLKNYGYIFCYSRPSKRHFKPLKPAPDASLRGKF